MRLIKELMKKQIELYNENELNHNYLISAWQFYACYNLALVITGFEDKNIKLKNVLCSSLLNSTKNKLNFSKYSLLLSYMRKDVEVINQAIQLMEKQMEESNFIGDYDMPDMVAVSIYD